MVAPQRFAVSDMGDAIITTSAATGLDPAHYGADADVLDAARGADDCLAVGEEQLRGPVLLRN
ncbi:hypothetical protein [Streptomyces sp. NPDC057257]|uniref:hypothetical protein n=1 Tax=Streptomyces sp. NPDC057257 TaxID=3346071 RepID=UPI00363F813C